ncbi:MAG: BACON domain-containing protein [Bacteroidales bacterium]|nr:BACON domain-containing protein [Bacteroidales bacterium]
MKKILYIAAAFAIAAACEKAPEMVEIHELGCAAPEAEVTSGGGEHYFQVVSDGTWTATLPGEASWLSFIGNDGRQVSFSGDAALGLRYDDNTASEREAVIAVSLGSRTLNLRIVQDGANSRDFRFENRNVLIAFTTGSYSFPFTCNVDPSTVSYAVAYNEGRDWIEEPIPGLLDGNLVFNAKENLQQERRGAIITLSSVDGVGRPLVARLYVSQMANGEVETIPVTVSDVLNFGMDDLDGENRIRRNYVLKGRVLNDNADGNGAPNHNLSIIVQDATLSGRTVYLQSLEPDGEGALRGLKLIFNTVEDNCTFRYDLLEINLRGLLFSAEGGETGDTPYNVTLSGASVVNVISSERGSASDVPQRHRTIATLTDEDVNTFVIIDDCEIPIRKGPFCPVDLRYTEIINKYPLVLRDAQGSVMYMVNNVGCAWARDGRGIPEGSGPVAGILVHERCDNFEWNSREAAASTMLPDYVTDRGYIGRYQIRPVTRAEIGISAAAEEASTRLLTEYRYCNALYPDKFIVNVQNDTLYPTWPEVENPIKNPEVNGYLCYSYGKIQTAQDWTHLGPVENGRITDIPGGNGVYDALGRSIHWSPLSYANTCGIIQGVNCSGWMGGYWWSGTSASPDLEAYFWEIEVSTVGLDASNAPLSLNLGTNNGYGEDSGAPRYWLLEYSTDKQHWTGVTAADYGAESWVDLTAKGEDYTYTIPDFPIIASKKQYNLPGNKYISINFPGSADVWGKEALYIHLRPAKNLGGSNVAAGGISYDGSAIANSRRSVLNYVGIRYKK